MRLVDRQSGRETGHTDLRSVWSAGGVTLLHSSVHTVPHARVQTATFVRMHMQALPTAVN